MEMMSLRGLVYTKFRSISEFASAIGWTRQKATNIVSGSQIPSLSDADKMSKALDVSLEDVAQFFLTHKSHV